MRSRTSWGDKAADNLAGFLYGVFFLALGWNILYALLTAIVWLVTFGQVTLPSDSFIPIK